MPDEVLLDMAPSVEIQMQLLFTRERLLCLQFFI